MKTPLDPRHQKRQAVVQELFAWEAQRTIPGGNSNSTNLDEVTQDIIKNYAEIDKIILECAPEWEIAKINRADLSVLRLAVYELNFKGTEPSKVIVDEAVELAKEFGTESSPAFVNGALGKAILSPKRILKIIADKLGVDEKLITRESNLKSDLNATELEITDLIAYLEKEFNTTISSDQKFQTVNDILEYFEDQID